MAKKLLNLIILVAITYIGSVSAQQMSQLVYEGNLGAVISAPPGWTYHPASVEDDKKGVLAAYMPINNSIKDTVIIISIFPSKKDIFTSEIENDKKFNLKNGAKFIGTEFQELSNHKKFAINTWQYQTNKNFIGLIRYPQYKGYMGIT